MEDVGIKNMKKIKNILVIDDDPLQNRLLEKSLKQNGFEVNCSADAAEGLQMAINKHPDLIVLDVMMPVINGFNFCRILKSEFKKTHISIILLTSRDKLEDVEIGLSMGADAYLLKPVNLEELLKTIRFIESMEPHKHA